MLGAEAHFWEAMFKVILVCNYWPPALYRFVAVCLFFRPGVCLAGSTA